MLRWSWIKLKPSLIFRIFWIKTHNSFWEQRSFSIQSHTHWKRDTQNKSLKARLAGAWLQILAKTGPCAASAPNKAQPSFFFFFSPSTLAPRLHLLHWICCYSLPSNVGPVSWAQGWFSFGSWETGNLWHHKVWHSFHLFSYYYVAQMLWLGFYDDENSWYIILYFKNHWGEELI